MQYEFGIDIKRCLGIVGRACGLERCASISQQTGFYFPLLSYLTEYFSNYEFLCNSKCTLFIGNTCTQAQIYVTNHVQVINNISISLICNLQNKMGIISIYD